jgi:hypothetical protein
LICRKLFEFYINRYLASTTGPSISISITYIVFVTEMQKRQTLEKGFTLIKAISQVLNPLSK